MRSARAGLVAGLVWLLAPAAVRAAEWVPPAPRAHFNDNVRLVAPDVAARLEARLRECERRTAVRLVVAVFESFPGRSLEDFTRRAANAWWRDRADGQRSAVLFVFVRQRRLRLEVGRGLTERLTTTRARQVVDSVAHGLRKGDAAGGLESGLQVLVAAVSLPPPRAQRAQDRPAPAPDNGGILAALAFVCLAGMVFVALKQRSKRWVTLGVVDPMLSRDPAHPPSPTTAGRSPVPYEGPLFGSSHDAHPSFLEHGFGSDPVARTTPLNTGYGGGGGSGGFGGGGASGSW